MRFNDFEVTPVGHATLSIIEGKLKVSNIGDSGLDGVQIDVSGKQNYQINFGKMPNIVDQRGVFKTSTLSKNNKNLIITTYESFKWYDEDSSTIKIGYNVALLPPEFTVFGNLEGEEVFSVDLNTSDLVPPYVPDTDEPEGRIGFLIVLGAAAAVVTIAAGAVSLYKDLTTKKQVVKSTITDANGKVTGYIYTPTEDPTPFDIIVDGEEYTVDEYGIKYTGMLPTIDDNTEYIYNPVAEIVTASKLGSFEIVSITNNA
ncbi:MAG: hypothetical protein LBO69_01295 [Ignavibacteria bacterium]|jgi:hypothetical protein|nr:hypothetical protein [Ignavibacteria bacterium]